MPRLQLISLVWNIALRQLMDRRRQALLITSAIVVGVTVLLVTISLFGGLLDGFVAKILDVAPHVTMQAEDAEGSRRDNLVDSGGVAVELRKNVEREERTRVRNVMTILRSIERSHSSELVAASPFLSTQALAVYGTNETTLPIKGVIPEREEKIADLSSAVIEGSVSRLSATRSGVLLGKRAASDLGVWVGNRVRLVSMTGEVYSAQVVGIYNVGVDAIDRQAIVNLRLAQLLDGAPAGDASGIGFQVADVASAERIAAQIERQTGKKTETWKETNSSALTIFLFLRALFYIVVGFVIVICGFGVANILLTTVIEKGRDIAVMKSLGFSRGAITLLYLMQGAIVAVVGGLVGCVLGAIAIKILGSLPNVGAGSGLASYESRTLPMGWSIWYFVAAIGGTLLISIIASVAPARTAAGVMPVEVLRGEK